MNSLRIVLKRAFGCLSVESKGKKADTSQRIVCIKAKIKQKKSITTALDCDVSNEPHTKKAKLKVVQMSFGGEEALFKPKCVWKAHLVQNKDGNPGLGFSEISDLHDHALSCFDSCGYKPRKITKLVSGQSKYIDRLLLNKTIFKKMGYAVENEAVHKHTYNQRITKAQEHINCLKESDESCLAGLSDSCKAVIGICRSLETTDEGFVFEYTVIGDKLDYIAFLWPSQIKALEYYSDLIFYR